MEQSSLPIVTARNLWKIVRLAFYMIKKGINKKKILLDLNLFMKRGKLAGKNLTKLMFHHHVAAATSGGREYEFSCTNTPLYRHSLRKNNHHLRCKSVEAVNNMWEIMVLSMNDDGGIEAYRTPMAGEATAGQLLIMDSPAYSVQDEDMHVDEAAQDFINRFYSQLKQQQIE